MKNLIRDASKDTRSNPSSLYDPNSYYFLIIFFNNKKASINNYIIIIDKKINKKKVHKRNKSDFHCLTAKLE